MNSEELTAAETDPVLTFGFPVLNQKSDTSRSDEVKAAERVLKDKRTALLVGTKVSMWQGLPGLESSQVLLSHVLHLMPTAFEN